MQLAVSHYVGHDVVGIQQLQEKSNSYIEEVSRLNRDCSYNCLAKELRQT